MAVGDWSTTNGGNGSVGGINIAEGCPPGNLNNAVREVMAQVKVLYDTMYISSGGPSGVRRIYIQADGGALPGTPSEGDILIEYTP